MFLLLSFFNRCISRKLLPGCEIKMASSATPRLIKRKQIHGAPGGGKKLQWVDSRRDTWEAEGTKNKCFGSALWQLLASWMTHSLRGRSHPSPAPSSLYHSFISSPPTHTLAQVGDLGIQIGITDQTRDLKCTRGHLKYVAGGTSGKDGNNWDARCPFWSLLTEFSSQYSKKLTMWL